MIYRIHEQDANTLLEKPETGMGYQVVNATQYERYGPTKQMVVYNTNLAVDLDSNFSINKRRIINEGYKSILNKVTVLTLDTNSIKVLNQYSIRETNSISLYEKVFNKRETGGKGATDSLKDFANKNEIFVRVSAFENDRRVDFENRKLKKGTFTTTKIDYMACVSTNDDPIDRYALPNNDKIKCSFYIKPTMSDILQRGIVQPAFDHSGGGIEAYFENGTSKQTLLFIREYGN